jgi:hypothetical protein
MRLYTDWRLRLSRPSFATQYPLPNSQDLGISPKASLAYPSQDDTNSQFLLSPVLNLPEAFGSAYVGETFSCTLCANNELDASDTTKAVSGVRIQGDMQTPSNPTGSPLDLTGSLDGGDGTVSPGPGESLQRVLRFEGKAASGRVRTFRKLYQFVAQQLLSVRTKAGDLTRQGGPPRYLLEAQLENMGEAAVCIEVSDSLVIPGISQFALYPDRAVHVVHFIYLGQRSCILALPWGGISALVSLRIFMIQNVCRLPGATPASQRASMQQPATRPRHLGL